MPDEVEIKFLVPDPDDLERKLRDLGFQQKTASTFECNTLYDSADKLRSRGEILRLRQYGDKWKLTHKLKGSEGRHKTRAESETSVSSGEEMDAILRALGFSPSFVYEKYRAEWSDGQGDAVVDRTPIGNLAELEGTPDWIDAIAKKLGIIEAQYITKSYGELFADWRKKSGSNARNMTFDEVKEG
jgi:adenylate cyclase, class 2